WNKHKQSNTPLKRKVFVGMSGGVDSSVSAALLKKEGHDVTGVFIKTWHPDFIECSWREDRQDAMRVCALLGISFETCNLEDVYKREVVDYMIREYATGRTPNPDVMCNQHVKFGAFFNWAREKGADMIATGHYARIEQSSMPVHKVERYKVSQEKDQTLYKPDELYKLLTGADGAKDQSYFLWTLTQDILARTLFPVGGYKKTKVREIATEFALPVAEKKDSQGVCFLGPVDMPEFLKRFVDVLPGNVLDGMGNVIGTHDGALLYTLGQRHGFHVNAQSPMDAPRYVVQKDMTQNTITVSSTPFSTESFSQRKEVVVSSIHWISGIPPQENEKISCRFRYRQPLRACRVEWEGTTDHARVIFNEPQSFVAPGQSLVVYKGEECLGGGVIDR
ncbi:MAG: tRNA 2-thiouridine(34) synthase MnmA, partial [Patescibacteria group bacterium]